jgi:hypothetical protein
MPPSSKSPRRLPVTGSPPRRPCWRRRCSRAPTWQCRSSRCWKTWWPPSPGNRRSSVLLPSRSHTAATWSPCRSPRDGGRLDRRRPGPLLVGQLRHELPRAQYRPGRKQMGVRPAQSGAALRRLEPILRQRDANARRVLVATGLRDELHDTGPGASPVGSRIWRGQACDVRTWCC